MHAVTILNVQNNIRYILKNSDVLKQMVDEGEICIVGAIYDVRTGKVDFI